SVRESSMETQTMPGETTARQQMLNKAVALVFLLAAMCAGYIKIGLRPDCRWFGGCGICVVAGQLFKASQRSVGDSAVIPPDRRRTRRTHGGLESSSPPSGIRKSFSNNRSYCQHVLFASTRDAILKLTI